MRHYIMSEIKLEGFDMLKRRAVTALPELLRDLALVMRFYDSLSNPAPPVTHEIIDRFRRCLYESLGEEMLAEQG